MVKRNEVNFKYLRSIIKAVIDDNTATISILKNKDNLTYTLYVNGDNDMPTLLTYKVDSLGDTEYNYSLISEFESKELCNILRMLGYVVNY